MRKWIGIHSSGNGTLICIDEIEFARCAGKEVTVMFKSQSTQVLVFADMEAARKTYKAICAEVGIVAP